MLFFVLKQEVEFGESDLDTSRKNSTASRVENEASMIRASKRIAMAPGDLMNLRLSRRKYFPDEVYDSPSADLERLRVTELSVTSITANKMEACATYVNTV